MKISAHNPLLTLTGKLISSGSLSFRRLHVLVFYYIKLSVSLLASVPLKIIYGKKIRQTRIPESPVFILGHFRSGTTYLHKLIASDSRFGFISNYDILCPNLSMLLGDGFGRLLQRITEYFGIRNYHFNNSIHQLFDPGEEDMYLISSGSEASAYWGFIFPRNGKDMFITDDSSDEHLEKWMNAYQYTLKYATCRSGGKRLLLKNPPNTGRIRLLLKLFPNAKFIYIHRNPYTLYYSMKNLWNKVITKYYSLQHITDEESDNTIYNYYSKLTDKYEEERNLIPEGNLVEISYEELESDPVETIRKIYYELNLPSFAFMQAALSNRLELEHQYRKFSYRYNNHELDRTASAWKTEIAHRGYVRPVTSPT